VTFRPPALINEVRRNLLARPLLTCLTISIAFATSLGVLVLSSSEVATIEARHAALINAGANVWMVSSEHGFEGGKCDNLQGHSGVVAAGFAIERQDAVMRRGESTSVLSLREVSPGYLRALWPRGTAPGDSVVAGSTLADRLGIGRGSLVVLESDTFPTGLPLVVDRVAPPSPRDASVDEDLILVRSPDSASRHCLVEAAPGATQPIEALLLNRFGTGTSTEPMVRRSVGVPNASEELQERVSRYLPLAGALVVLCVLLGSWHSRRVEFALYRTSGMSAINLFAMLCLELLATGLLGASAGLLGWVVAASKEPIPEIVAVAAAQDWAVYVLLLAIAPALGYLLVGRSRTILSYTKGK
jgi:hypothetical protein